MKIDGACHCGRISYEAEIDPERVRLCHCTDCQSLSGSAFRITAPTPEADYRLLRGEPKIYRKTAESGAVRLQAFCGDCGSPLYATSEGEGTRTFGIRLGTARQRAELTPRRQFWWRSRLPFVEGIGCLESFDKQDRQPSAT
jgi:hypothetical protein